MPTINDPNVVRAIAREYCTNGHNKPQALITVGYKPSYANGGKGTGLYQKEPIKKAIEAFEKDMRLSSEMTVEKVQAMYKEMYDLSKTNNQPSAGVSAVTGIARLYGMDKDASQDKQDAPPLTADELKEYMEAAKVVTKPKIVENKTG